MDENLSKRLEKHLTDSEKVSRQEFLEALNIVAKFIQDARNTTEQEVEDIRKALEVVKAEIKNDNQGALDEMKGRVDHLFVQDQLQSIRTTLQDLVDTKLAEVDARVANIRDGRDGAKGDKGDKGNDGSPDTPRQVRLKMEQAGLSMNAVDGLLDRLKKIEENQPRLKGTVGSTFGGAGAMQVAAAFTNAVRTETPAGAVDGANLTYTVTQPINTILSFGINGMIINDNEFSVSGRTITMNAAIPASLSGTSFRIRYI